MHKFLQENVRNLKVDPNDKGMVHNQHKHFDEVKLLECQVNDKIQKHISSVVKMYHDIDDLYNSFNIVEEANSELHDEIKSLKKQIAEEKKKNRRLAIEDFSDSDMSSETSSVSDSKKESNNQWLKRWQTNVQ